MRYKLKIEDEPKRNRPTPRPGHLAAKTPLIDTDNRAEIKPT